MTWGELKERAIRFQIGDDFEVDILIDAGDDVNLVDIRIDENTFIVTGGH